MAYSFFVQSIAIIALIFFAASFQAKSRKQILLLQAASLIIWIIHFSLLSAWTGVILNFINFVITILFLYKDRIKSLNNRIFLYISLIALVVATFSTWAGFFSFFALCGVSFITIAKWQTNPQKIRFISIFASILWILYDFFVGSYGGIISESVIIVSIFISLFKSGVDKVNK